MSKSLDIAGMHFNSYSEAAKYCGIDSSVLGRRIKKYGKDSPLVLAKKHVYAIDGEKVDKLWVYAQKHNFSYQRLRRYMATHNNVTTKEIVKYFNDHHVAIKRRKSGVKKPIAINGLTFATYAEAAKYCGISESALSIRVKRYGKNNPMVLAKRRLFVINGVTYQSLREVERKANLSHTAFVYRWKKYQKGLLKEKDLLKPSYTLSKNVKRRGHRITINGITYNSLKEIEDKHHISHTAFMYRWRRYRHGLIKKEDLVKPVKHYEITIKGVKYVSLSEVERKYRISHTAFMYRLGKYKAGEISEDDLIRPANGRRLTKKVK